MTDYKKYQRPEFMVCLVLSLAILIVYRQITFLDFINFDDLSYITYNPNVSGGITSEGVSWAFELTDIAYWLPMTWLSHMLDVELFGLNPGMHHLTSLLLHMANTLLLFFALKRMTRAVWPSAVVAGLFGLHPLNVESVVWIAERKNVLSTLFWMLTLLTYARYIEKPGIRRYLIVVAVFALGLTAKPMLVTLPFVLLLLDFWPLNRVQWLNSAIEPESEDKHYTDGDVRRSSVFRLIAEKIPLLAIASVSIVLSLSSVKQIISPQHVSLYLRVENALVSYVRYLGKMVWPQRLAVFYPYPETLPGWQVGAAVLLLIGVSVLFIRKMKTNPYLVVGWFWFLGTLVPVIGVLQWGLWPAMADRFTYVPLVGLFICVVWGTNDVLSRSPHAATVRKISAVAALTALSICTSFQVPYWQNSRTLFTHALNVTHNNGVAHYVLGAALEQEGKIDAAMMHYTQSIRMRPYYKTFFRMGSLLDRQGKLDEAAFCYSKFLQMNPADAVAHNNLGTVMARKSNIEAARQHYFQALAIDPNYAGAYFNLGSLSAKEGQTEQAILYYDKALQINPNMAEALYRQAWTAATHPNENFRDGLKALQRAEKLCRVTGEKAPLALDALSAAYAELGRYADAVATAQKAYRLALMQGADQAAQDIKNRIDVYQAGRPFRQILPNGNDSQTD